MDVCDGILVVCRSTCRFREHKNMTGESPCAGRSLTAGVRAFAACAAFKGVKHAVFYQLSKMITLRPDFPYSAILESGGKIFSAGNGCHRKRSYRERNSNSKKSRSGFSLSLLWGSRDRTQITPGDVELVCLRCYDQHGTQNYQGYTENVRPKS